MRRIVPALAVMLVASACSGSGGASTSTEGSVVSTVTSTTVDIRVCEDLADDAVRWLDDLVAVFDDGIRWEVLNDRAQWPESLVRLDEEGAALQAESDAAGCDEGLIRGAVVAAASEMSADSATAELLLEWLAPSG